MDCKEEIVDTRKLSPEEFEIGKKNAEQLFKVNHTLPTSSEYNSAVRELFYGQVGEGSRITAPLQGVCFERVRIGQNVYIGSNLLLMARGGITIEDDVQIAANVQLLSNNHDLYDRALLLCKPIHIKKGAWIGAGVTILAGVSVGQHAVVGAGSVVTKDVPDYGVVVGNPARLIRTLDQKKFGE